MREVGEYLIFIIDIIYLIFSDIIAGFLSAYFCWVPNFVFDIVFPLLILLDTFQRIGYVAEKLKIWKNKH